MNSLVNIGSRPPRPPPPLIPLLLFPPPNNRENSFGNKRGRRGGGSGGRSSNGIRGGEGRGLIKIIRLFKLGTKKVDNLEEDAREIEIEIGFGVVICLEIYVYNILYWLIFCG